MILCAGVSRGSSIFRTLMSCVHTFCLQDVALALVVPQLFGQPIFAGDRKLYTIDCAVKGDRPPDSRVAIMVGREHMVAVLVICCTRCIHVSHAKLLNQIAHTPCCLVSRRAPPRIE
eukprot:SAG31_NODE_24986_length_470_cov_0.978437_1_plen_116_part_10